MAIRDPDAYRQYMRQYMLDRYHRRKRELTQFLGGKCYSCDATEELQFDHVRRELKRFTISQLLNSIPMWRAYQEIMACQLLCGTCHRAKSGTEGSVGHGGGLTGTRNCYCDLCGPLKRKYNQNLKVRRAIDEALRSFNQGT